MKKVMSCSIRVYELSCKAEYVYNTCIITSLCGRIKVVLSVPVSPERGIFRPPPRSHLGETHANVACQCVILLLLLL